MAVLIEGSHLIKSCLQDLSPDRADFGCNILYTILISSGIFLYKL